MPRQSAPPKKSLPSMPKPLVPAPVSPVQAPSSFGQIVKEGLAFGVGQAVAHRAVASVAGIFSSTQTSQPPSPSQPLQCEKEWIAFDACMKTKSSDDFCGSEQIAFTQCLRLTRPPSLE